MDVRNCKTCSRLFNYIGGPILCQGCREKLEQRFADVKEYIYDHPRCGIAEVAEECEVPTQQIKQWLREERLEFSSDSSIGLNCESCGVAIRTGRFCEKCKNKMANQLSHAYKKEMPQEDKEIKKTKENPKMRFLDH